MKCQIKISNKYANRSVNHSNLFRIAGGGIFGYLVISFVAIGLLATFILRNNNSVEAADNIGVAALTGVEITKAGTATTVSYLDGSTLTGNPSARQVLNNDEVIYRATYQITTPGQVEISLTMPANNTVSEASISSAAGCSAGSKLEKVAVAGQTSYTPNKAICIVNADTPGTIAWSISTNPWGSNGQTIVPSLAVAGAESTIKPSAITVVGKPKYKIAWGKNGASQGSGNGWNNDVRIFYGVYTPVSSTRMLGVEPLKDGAYTAKIDTSSLPSGWKIGALGVGGFAITTGIVKNGDLTASIADSGKTLVVGTKNAVIGVPHYPIVNNNLQPIEGYYFSTGSLSINIPVSELPDAPKTYNLLANKVQLTGASGQTVVVDMSPTSLSWTLSARSYGRPMVWGTRESTNVAEMSPPGWKRFYEPNQPIYPGQQFKIGPYLQLNSISTSTHATNLNYCYAYSSALRTISELQMYKDSTLESTTRVEYGVISGEANGVPNSSLSNCGKVGDSKTNVSFFASLDQANKYAESKGQSVNAVRFSAGKAQSGRRDLQLGESVFQMVSQVAAPTNISHSASATTDQWSIRDIHGNSSQNQVMTWTMVPGLLTHKITAEPSSTAPNTEDHITITPITFDRDNNAKIITDLPMGLQLKNGTVRVGNTYLTNGRDYTVTQGGDGLTSITFNMDNIANSTGLPMAGELATYPAGCTDSQIANKVSGCLPIAKDGEKNRYGVPQGIARSPIEFDVLVDSNISVPSVLNISSKTTGSGTDYANVNFRTKSASVSIASREEFGYSLTSSASSIYTGEKLTYRVANHNSMAEDVNGVVTVNVLPYSDDSRGTSNLGSYSVEKLGLSGVQTGAKLFYTTSSRVRELEKTNPAALATDNQIAWT